MSRLGVLNQTEVNTPLILVIDDDPVVRNMLLRTLQKQDYGVIEALNGAEGVDLFRHHHPDLVLMDVFMPVMNGFEACRHMRELDPECTVPILMLTGLDDVDSVERAFHAGATDFIPKPVNWSLFAHRIRYALKAREMDFELRKNRHRVDHVLRTSLLGYWDWDLDTGKISMPPSVQDMLGMERSAELSFEEFMNYVHEDDRDRVTYVFDDARQRGARFVVEHRMQGSDHRERYVYQQCDIIMGEDKRPSYILGTIQDVTPFKRAEEMILHQAYHDLLTDLPNQTLFKERLTHAIRVAEHAHHQLAVIVLDIDRFQVINESLGHDVGNELLVAFAGFLSAFVFEGDTVARMSGDEFALLLESPSSIAEINQVISSIHQGLKEQAFDLAGKQVFLSLSIGVAIYPNDSLDAGGLIQCATAAMRRAKAKGGGQEHFYTHDMNRRVDDRLQMEADLRQALENREIEVYYQPQIDVRTRRIVAAEALARWHHREQGVISPIRFIPLAEETGLIKPLGYYVLEHALEQSQRWHEKAYDISMAVNLSARQFTQPDLVEQIGGLLEKYQHEPSRIELEITESTAMQDAENSINKLHQLKALGVQLSMDDFGTGYSSLSYLHRFPLDVLKIDRSFVMDINGRDGDGAIARAVIAMSRSMGLKVIAEGVETEQQLSFLRKYGCDMAQGYLVSPPLPVAEFETLLLSLNGDSTSSIQ